MDTESKQKPHQMRPIVRQPFQNAQQKINIFPAGLLYALYGMLLTMAGCKASPPPENPSTWQKIRVNFKKLDENGLSGTAGGKVAVNYEFCIPASKKNWRAVQKIDPTARQYPQSKGRIGCRDDQWLIIGSTRQDRYRRVLFELASLPYVERIEETYWE
jgi:hypothetical protein